MTEVSENDVCPANALLSDHPDKHRVAPGPARTGDEGEVHRGPFDARAGASPLGPVAPGDTGPGGADPSQVAGPSLEGGVSMAMDSSGKVEIKTSTPGSTRVRPQMAG